MKQAELLRELLQEIDQVPDHQVQEIIAGERGHLVAVQSVRMGIATWAVHHPVPIQNVPLIQARGSARVLARSILSEDPMEATIGLASLNSMLPSPPAHQLQSIKAQELIVRCGRGKKVAVIGHFPFVEELADEFSHLWILEKSPRPGDIKAEEAPHILPLADLVAISATTLANGTLAEILSCCSTMAKKVMLGPS
ncbi:MAG: DUF364 domain-containing protein, partial [Desulforhabdus sp.]|nr:DUF364 domain-containing protein [Desulforhabdus sp.]